MFIKHNGNLKIQTNCILSSGSDNRRATSIVKWHENSLKTSQILAHELAHNLGVRHDFLTYKGRGWTCGPPRDEDGGDIMNYGTPKGSVWSPCTQRDFQNYYNRVIQTLSNFCLPEYTGEFYMFQNRERMQTRDLTAIVISTIFFRLQNN